MKNRKGFTLLEVLTALFLLAVGLTAVMETVVMSNRKLFDATRLSGAVRIAQREVTLATLSQPPRQSQEKVVDGPYTFSVTFSDRKHGLQLATVVVQWPERGVARTYQLSRVFRPREKSSG